MQNSDDNSTTSPFYDFRTRPFDGINKRVTYQFWPAFESEPKRKGLSSVFDDKYHPLPITLSAAFRKVAHDERIMTERLAVYDLALTTYLLNASKEPKARWRAGLLRWNADTVAFHATAGHMTQVVILDEEERIGIKPVEPTYVFPKSDCAKYGKKDLDKTEEKIFKQQKMAGQVLVVIRNRCKQQVLNHADLILNAPGAALRTKLIVFVKVIEDRPLCDVTVVSIVQDDIKGLNPVSTFPDAIDNIIAINLLQ
jgi:hypothetical protein